MARKRKVVEPVRWVQCPVCRCERFIRGLALHPTDGSTNAKYELDCEHEVPMGTPYREEAAQ
jgi:hypothetical protein